MRQAGALLLLYGTLFGALLLFAELAEHVYRKEGFGFDGPILTWFHQIRSPVGDWVALTLTGSASLPLMVLWVLGLGLWAALRKRPWLPFLLLVGGTELLNLAGKFLFARPRPHLFPQITPESDFSFPSGHTMASLALALGLYWLLEDEPGRARRVLALASL
ncbi:hypothetical protein YIM730264_11890 [Thermus hydrothermalis]